MLPQQFHVKRCVLFADTAREAENVIREKTSFSSIRVSAFRFQDFKMVFRWIPVKKCV